ASNGIELLQILSTKLDHVILLDLEMPVMDGCKAFKNIRAEFPEARVIILTMYGDVELKENYRARGAYGFLDKDYVSSNMKVLADAIHTVHHSEKYYVYNDDKSVKFTDRET